MWTEGHIEMRQLPTLRGRTRADALKLDASTGRTGADSTTFAAVEALKPSRVWALVGKGLTTYKSRPALLSVLSLLVLGLYGTARNYAASLQTTRRGLALLVDVIGLVGSTVLALPWFKTSLVLMRDSRAPLRELLRIGEGLGPMLTASAFFWAGILLGVRYSFGIGALFVLVWYGLFGYAVAAGEGSGLKALGSSVRLGQKSRLTVAALGAVLLTLNLMAALPIGVQQTPFTILLATALLVVTTNISIGAGAHLFSLLTADESSPRRLRR